MYTSETAENACHFHVNDNARPALSMVSRNAAQSPKSGNALLTRSCHCFGKKIQTRLGNSVVSLRMSYLVTKGTNQIAKNPRLPPIRPKSLSVTNFSYAPVIPLSLLLVEDINLKEMMYDAAMDVSSTLSQLRFRGQICSHCLSSWATMLKSPI